MVNQKNPPAMGDEGNDDYNTADDGDEMGGFHNPLFSSAVGMPKDKRCVPVI